jgi:hypothetical protein
MKIEKQLADDYAVVRIGDKYSVLGQPFKREWYDSLAACLLAWEINKPTNMKESLSQKSLDEMLDAMYPYSSRKLLSIKPTKIFIHPSNLEMVKQTQRIVP